MYFDDKVKKYVRSTKEMAKCLKEAIDLYAVQYKIESKALEDLVFYYIDNYRHLWTEGATKHSEEPKDEFIVFTIRVVLGKKRTNILKGVAEELWKADRIDNPLKLMRPHLEEEKSS